MEHDLEPPPSLSEHATFVRRLARQLTLDPGTADDLVQETFVRALRRPLPPLQSARAWLATVLRNVFRDQRAAERARRQREQEVARHRRTGNDNGSDPLGIDLLTRALAALPADYRHAIHLRYYAQHSIDEMAAELGVPAATVKTRLHRGLGMLRADLAARAGGDAGVRALLLPLALAPATAAAAAVPPLLAATWLPQLAAAALVGGLLFAGLQPDGPQHARPEVAAASASQPAVVASLSAAPLAAIATAVAVPAERELVAAATARLTGIIVHATTRQPVPFCRLAVRDATRSEDLCSDANGHFATAAAFAAEAEIATEDAAPPAALTAGPRPVAQRGATPSAATVGAVDAVGAVPMAQLLAGSAGALPVLPAVPAVPRAVTVAWRRVADLQGPAGLEVPVAVGPTYFVATTLPPGRTAAAFEVALLPSNTANVHWEQRYRDGRVPLETAADGSGRLWCRLPNAPERAGGFLTLMANDGLWVGSATVRTVVGVQEEPVAIELQASGIVQGTVRDPAGAPCTRVRVLLVHTDAASIHTACDLTDDAGRFRIAFAGPGPARLEISGEDVETCRRAIVVPAGGSVTQDLLWQPRPIGGAIGGTITTTSGAEFAGCSVILTSRNDASIWRSAALCWREVDGRRQARFEFAKVPLAECDVTLHAFQPCAVAVTGHRVTAPQQDLAFVIDDRPALRAVRFAVTCGGRAATGDWAIHLASTNGWRLAAAPTAPGVVEVALPAGQQVTWQLVGHGIRARSGSVRVDAGVCVDVATEPGWSASLRSCEIANFYPARGVQVFADDAPAGTTDAAGALLLDLVAAPATLRFDTSLWRVFEDGAHRSDIDGATGLCHEPRPQRPLDAASGLFVYLQRVH